ncbi:MAG: flippase-like domain-containing protein [Bacteroidetes bacterium]|nr:MAG: flippase-like domain-containing protein [Bacteroidota bacterium]
MKINWIQLIKTVLPLALGIYLIWIFFTGMSQKSLDTFYQAIREANYVWIVLALVMTITACFSRAFRWKLLLEPLGYQSNFWNRYHAIMIGYLINMTIPRAGEASRAAMLYRSDGVPFSKGFGTIVAERAVDLFMLGSIALFTFFLAAEDFKEILLQIKNRFSPVSSDGNDTFFTWKVLLIILILIVGIVIFLLWKKENWRQKLFQFIRGVWDGLLSIFKAKNPLLFAAHSLFIWALYVCYFWICFFSLDATEDLPAKAILLAFLAGSLGIMFTNGGIGTFPLLVGLVVVYYLGDEQPQALAIGNAIGMLIWVSQTLFLILLGLISLFLLPKNHQQKDVTT